MVERVMYLRVDRLLLDRVRDEIVFPSRPVVNGMLLECSDLGGDIRVLGCPVGAFEAVALLVQDGHLTGADGWEYVSDCIAVSKVVALVAELPVLVLYRT